MDVNNEKSVRLGLVSCSGVSSAQCRYCAAAPLSRTWPRSGSHRTTLMKLILFGGSSSMGKRHPMSYNAKTRVLGECSTVNTVLLTLELKLFCSTVPYRICTKALGLHLHGESTWYTRHSNASCDLRVSHTRYAFNVPRMPVPPIHHAVASARHFPT